MSVINKVKDAIIEFNARRTLPDSVFYEYEGSYWVQCSKTKKEPKFVDEIDEPEYKFKYSEYKQSKYGCWFRTGIYLFSDSNIEILKRTSK